jgi:hypothetical protein
MVRKVDSTIPSLRSGYQDVELTIHTHESIRLTLEAKPADE